MTISSKFSRFFFGDSKRGKDRSSAGNQADDRSPAASGSQADDSMPAASSIDGTRMPVEDTTKVPWPAVCALMSHFRGETEKGSVVSATTQGTGFFFSDATVISAAHNLWKNVDGKVLQAHTIDIKLANGLEWKRFALKSPNVKDANPTFEPKYDAQYVAYLEAQAKTKRKSEEWQKFDELMSYIDFGAILLSRRLVPVPAFFFRISGTMPEDSCWDKPLVSTGYSLLDGSDDLYKLYYANGTACRGNDRFIGPNKDLVRHNAAVEEGQSGGPIYLLHGDDVVGIQVKYNPSTGSDLSTFGAVRITKEMQNSFETWDREHRDSLGPREDLIA
jgi:V8-like Glu-specific endopeptidase